MTSEVRKKVDEEKKIKTRNVLINSAVEVFIEYGYHQSNISAIVAKAEVGQGTFYRHFKSKREIFEVILKKMIKELVSELSGSLSDINRMPKSFKEYKEMFILATLATIPVIKRNKKIIILFLREAPTIDRAFEDEVDKIFWEFSDLVKYYLDDAIEKKYTRACNSKIVSTSIIGMGTQLLKDWLYEKYDDDEIESIIIEIADLVFLGISTPSV